MRVITALLLIIGTLCGADTTSEAKARHQTMTLLDEQIAKIDIAWSKGEHREVCALVDSFARTHPESAGAQTLRIFTALYFERDWERADRIEKEIVAKGASKEQREDLTALLKDTTDVKAWKELVHDDAKYNETMAALRSAFKTKFPGSQAALLVESAVGSGRQP